MQFSMHRPSVIGALTLWSSALLLVVVGCSDPSENRVGPATGFSTDAVSYAPSANPMAVRVAVPTANFVGASGVPAVLPAIAPQKVSAPIRFDGIIDGLPAGSVVIRFYRNDTRVVANEMSGFAQPSPKGTGISYSVMGTTPVETGRHQIEILLTYPDAAAEHHANEPAPMLTAVIATGEMDLAAQ